MAIIAAFIARVDVPNENAEGLQMIDARMKVYRLASISPKQLVTSLIAMDALEPRTRLDVDEDNNAIIAHASIADHYAIQQVIDRLDGSARKFDVIQLRRLRADDVAGTIKFLMGADKEKKDDDQNRRRFLYYDPWGQNNNDKKKKDDSFRVGANVEDNQILLWANEIERDEINKLLIKLGEIPAEGARPNPFRTIDASRSPETLEYLKRLQDKWKSISPNPLVIPSPDEFIPEQPGDKSPESSDSQPSPEKGESSDDSKSDKPEKKESNSPPTAQHSLEHNQLLVRTTDPSDTDRSSASSEATVSKETPVADRGKEGGETSSELAAPPTTPPIRIQFDSEGNLLLSSQDLAALDKLELLMLQDAPPSEPMMCFKSGIRVRLGS